MSRYALSKSDKKEIITLCVCSNSLQTRKTKEIQTGKKKLNPPTGHNKQYCETFLIIFE